ncbi:MAG: hypothetical protein H6725_21845 [Sandaracinaceae bacterium]|nr:hypothetical protein [Sandaracinaceae bacterium]
MRFAFMRPLVSVVLVVTGCGGDPTPDATEAPATSASGAAALESQAGARTAGTSAAGSEVRTEQPGDAIALAAGTAFACALRRAGEVACWGSNTDGQLGQGHTEPVEGAVTVLGIDDAVAIAASLSTACAARRGGRVVCWGSARSGALGTGDELRRRELVEVPGVRGATALFAGTSRFCAVTGDETWCWGLPDSRVEERAPLARGEASPSLTGPVRLSIRGVRALRLDQRRYALLADGAALVWDYATGPERLTDVADVLTTSGLTCVVSTPGDVRCETVGNAQQAPPRVPEGLRSPRALVYGNGTRITALMPDGTLLNFTRYPNEAPEQRSFEQGAQLVSIATGGAGLLGITVDGRVREWGHTPPRDGVWPVREVTLPALGGAGRPAAGAPSDAAALPDGPMPRYCSVDLRVVAPSVVGTLQQVIAVCISEEPESYSAEDLCRSVGIGPGSSACPTGGPYFAKDGENGPVALVVPLGGGRYGLLPELALHSAGTEESSLVEDLELRAGAPFEAWLRVSESSQGCLDDLSDDPSNCGLSEDAVRYVVVTPLPDARFLITEVRSDSPRARRANAASPSPPTVSVSAAGVDVWACGGHVTRPLPALEPAPGGLGATAGTGTPSEPAVGAAQGSPNAAQPAGPGPSAEAVVAASARCNAGWARFRAGDVAGARGDVDAALSTLSAARDAAGLRSLGACLYNRGRIAEEERQLDAARGYYQRSLAARPNDTVQARLAGLPAP